MIHNFIFLFLISFSIQIIFLQAFSEPIRIVKMLAGKRVVIFGGSSGMGKATAKAAVRSGAHTTIVGECLKD